MSVDDNGGINGNDADTLIDAGKAAADPAAAKAAADAVTATAAAAKSPFGFVFDEKASEQTFGKLGDDGRPANVPGKYWDADKKAIKADVLLSQLRWAEGKIGKPLEMLGAPAADAKYEVALPAEFAEAVAIDPEDPRVQGFLEVARKHDLNQNFVNEVLTAVATKVRDVSEATIKAEIAKLGDGGVQKLNDMSDLLDANLPPEQAQLIKSAFSSAELFTAIDSLIGKLQPPRFADKTALAAASNERASLQERWRELYFATDDNGQRKVAIDDNYRHQVEELRDKAFGTTRRDGSGRTVDAAGNPIAA